MIPRSLATVLFVTSGLSLAAGDVWVVDPNGGGDFTTINAAVAAASDGDALLLRTHFYDEFVLVDGKDIDFISESKNTSIKFLRIINSPSGSETPLMAFQIPAISAGLSLEFNAGRVVGERLVIGADGLDAVFVIDCADVVLVEVNAQGGDGADGCLSTDPGGDGIEVSGSKLSLYKCTALGGLGGDDTCNGFGGLGGDGMFVRANSQVFVVDSTFEAGLGGCPGGDEGCDIRDNGSNVTFATHAEPFLIGPRVLREGEWTTLRIVGPPGAAATLVIANSLQRRQLVPSVGVLHLKPPYTLVPLGAIPPGGVLGAKFQAPALAPNQDYETLWMQAVIAQPGNRFLTNVTGLQVLDTSF